ncbi:trans-aconitate 2-methyltransferase [Martelella endophytica]|uniref:Trans-aconitate 2-methyltransferase n=1 Tax=Martelella endophytica TaxID=1486262 RepID=A0A0D5LU31_MAREN|nr:trans-aconitate 2-methyltransferase [Martelella endophytica]AJY47475.1 trans-aconitate methyltransferase [Martelella endophytica]
MEWSATQYLKFEDERSRPARDLINALPDISPGTVIDLGCGPGNSTELLAERFPNARISGNDVDDDMLAKARARMPGTRFDKVDLEEWLPESPPDLMFSNAVFQWVPDHLSVLARLMGALAADGVLAVQMPDNLAEPSHLAMEETARDPAFTAHFSGGSVRRSPLPAPKTYYDRLKPFAARLDLFHITYHHPLADAAAIVEWVKGTGLRPYLARIPAEAEGDFLAAYTERIAKSYPAMEDGRVLLKFPRLFLVATKA